jgi:hypothetical protein
MGLGTIEESMIVFESGFLGFCLFIFVDQMKESSKLVWKALIDCLEGVIGRRGLN